MAPEVSQSDDGADGEQEPSRQPMSETAWLSVTDDGAVYITYLDADGRYRDTQQGETVMTGAWEYNASDALCFIPDEGAKACWTHGSADSDGVLRATNEDGREIELKRVTYSPAAVSGDGSEDAPQDPASGPGEG